MKTSQKMVRILASKSQCWNFMSQFWNNPPKEPILWSRLFGYLRRQICQSILNPLGISFGSGRTWMWFCCSFDQYFHLQDNRRKLKPYTDPLSNNLKNFMIYCYNLCRFEACLVKKLLHLLLGFQLGLSCYCHLNTYVVVDMKKILLWMYLFFFNCSGRIQFLFVR